MFHAWEKLHLSVPLCFSSSDNRAPLCNKHSRASHQQSNILLHGLSCKELKAMRKKADPD